ncbi:hypothetical protein KFE25_008254 [Diacronema lutheri]|uniref:O-methyltransferase domain-containing protein n=1 Tax=Diacronema lutheri TaxID=2081491 RepID=A0A8J5XS25_DIALT|nr:hypothetical protein KFE25_008254 [Diacronema lutheri]
MVSTPLRSPSAVAAVTAVPPSSAPELDPVARFVDENPYIRRMLAYPVGFVSASNWLASSIYVAAKLRVFDALSHGPRTVAQIATEVDADVDALARLLRALGGQGPVPGVLIEVFDSPLPFAPAMLLPALPQLPFSAPRAPALIEESERRYALTPLGALLRTDAVGSMRPWAIFSGEELGRAWSNGLLEAVRNGKPDFGASQRAPASAAPSGFFEYMAAHADAGARFDASMEAVSEYAGIFDGLGLFDWSLGGRASTIVDVGGGTGTMLCAILKAHRTLRGTLFDRSEVLGRAPAVLQRAAPGVRERVELVPGSFFDAPSIPAGADVYVLKNIAHDWADDDAARLLRCVGSAMRADSVLVLLDVVRSARLGYEPWVLDFADFYDLNMLVTVGGKERSRAEWERLLHSAGFELVSIRAGAERGVSAIEATLRAGGSPSLP